MNHDDLREQVRAVWRRSLDQAQSGGTTGPRRRPAPALIAAAVVTAAIIGVALLTVDRTGEADVATDGPAVSDDAVPEAAVLPSALSEPGTPIGDGFKIAEGSALIGTLVPLGVVPVIGGEPVVDEGWTAYLYVTGDPTEVVDRYLTQAEAAGLTPSPLDGEIVVTEDQDVPPTGYERCGTVSDGSYACAASAGDGASRCLTASVVRSETASHLQLTYMLQTTDASCRSRNGLAVNADLDPPGPPTEWPQRSTPGTEFGGAWGALAAVTVQEGSQVAAAPVAAGDCGPYAVLEVTADPNRVLNRYVDVIVGESAFDPGVTPERATSGTLSLDRRTIYESGGGRLFRADLVTTNTGDAWLYLTGC